MGNPDRPSYFRIKPAQSETIISEVVQAIAAWRQTGARLGMTAQELDDFVDAFNTEN
ncbi:MAG: hypothetical protein HN919_21775 [Verrucomicrobia bacterium]|nr:hypothetical protein [Verrucomicrobiota bacterium]